MRNNGVEGAERLVKNNGVGDAESLVKNNDIGDAESGVKCTVSLKVPDHENYWH